MSVTISPLLATLGVSSVTFALGWLVGRHLLRECLRGYLHDLHDLRVNGIHSAVYWRHYKG